MSCEGNRHHFFAHLAGKSSILNALGLSAQQAVQFLDRLYQTSRAAALGKRHSDVEEAVETVLTQKLFDRMRAIGLKPPTHSRDGLPKMAARFGYGQVERMLQAIEAGKPLPKQAADVLQQIQAASAPPKKSAAISALGYDAKGYFRCANCGRFASQTKGHVCPMTASSRELSAMLQRRLGLPASAFSGYRADPLEDLLDEARQHGTVTMVHSLTGQTAQVTLDGIPQAMQNGFLPTDWQDNAAFVLAEHRDGSTRVVPVLDAEGLTRAEEKPAAVAALAQAYGWPHHSSAPMAKSVARILSNGLKAAPQVVDGPVALQGGQEYDLGHFIGTEFRKASARGTFVEIGGRRYGVYARSKNPDDKSSARGRFATDVDNIVVGRTLPAAIGILAQGRVAYNDGMVEVYDVEGNLLSLYDTATHTAGDMAGNPNASPEQMAAILAARMLEPQTALDYALIQDFARFRRGQGSPLAAADSGYLALRQWMETSGQTLRLGARPGARRCPNCGRFIGNSEHVCPVKQKQQAPEQPVAAAAPQIVPEQPVVPAVTAPAQPQAAQVAPEVHVEVALPDDFAETLANAMRDILTTVQTGPKTDDQGLANALAQLTQVVARQQETLQKLTALAEKQPIQVSGSAGSLALDAEALGAAIGNAVAQNIPAPVVVSGEGGAAAIAPRRRCPKCGQYMGENHTCPPRVPRKGLQRPADVPPTEVEQILDGITLPEPDLYLDNVPEEWGGKRAIPLPENLPEFKPEYEMGDQERMIFKLIAMQLKKKSKKPTNRAFGLYGPAGTGKNTIARQLAASLKTEDGKQGLPYREINITPDMDIQQAIGEVVLTTDENGQTVSQVRLGPIGLVAAGGGVAAINEIVRSPKLATALQSIIEDGELSIPTPEGGAVTVPVHPSAIFITTWNPGYEGDADRPAQAFLSRITALPLDYPSKEAQIRRLGAHFDSQGLPRPPKEVLDAAVSYFSELRELTGGTGQTPQIGTMSPTPTTPGPREMARFVEIGTSLGWDEALKTLEVICDQDSEYKPAQVTILRDRFEAYFTGIV